MVPTVIIVNYRTADLTIDCLRSLVDELQPQRGDRVIVVDGHSQDGSDQRLREAIDQNGWGDWMTLLLLDRNGGFAFANNAAVRHAEATDHPSDCYWLLNPDTVMQPGTLNVLMTFLADHPQAGIVGGGIEDPEGMPEHASFRFPSLWSELDLHLRWGLMTRLLSKRIVAPPINAETHRADWVSGANVIIRKDVFDDVGLMDEGYFLYYEETDLCRRAADAGWECWNVPAGRVTHLGGASTGILHANHEVKRRPTYWFDSRRRYFLKHYGRPYTAVTDGISVLSLLLWNCRRVIQRKPQHDPPGYLLDLCRHSALRGGGLQ